MMVTWSESEESSEEEKEKEVAMITRLLVAWHVRVSTKFIPKVLTLK